MQSLKLTLKTFFRHLCSISRTFKEKLFLNNMLLHFTYNFYLVFQSSYPQVNSLRDPHFALRKWFSKWSFLIENTRKSPARTGVRGRRHHKQERQSVTRPREGPGSGNAENRYPDSRCEALTRGQSPQVSDGQGCAVR